MSSLTLSSFKGQLLLALLLSIGLKVLTFSLSTILTRLLLPYQNGVNFTFSVYNEAVLFIVRETTRNVASRLPIIEPSAEAEDSIKQNSESVAAHDMSPGERGGAPSPPSAPSVQVPASVVKVANVRAVVSIALCSVPLAFVVAAVVEAFGMCLGTASFFPSMMQHALASQQMFRKVPNVGGLDGASTLVGHPFLLLPYLPEMTVVICTLLMTAVEPCVVLAQSLNLFRVVVLAECATLVARLCAIIGIVYACQRNSTGGSTPGDEVGNGLLTIWETRMTLAFGQLAYAVTHVVYYTLVLSGLPVARWLGSSTSMEQVRAAALLAHARGDVGQAEQDAGADEFAGAAKPAQSSALPAPPHPSRWATFAFPFCLYSIVDSVSACRRYASLLNMFLWESLLRVVLAKGESLTLTSVGSETARGYYQLISGLGSLVARLLFRVWENACFVKWSREASLGHRHTSVHLLKLMLRVAFYVSFFFSLLGPPLTKTFLTMVYTSRWATPQVSTALQLYFYSLPLIAWSGLLEAFLRAVASPALLQRLQRWMVGETALYMTACYVTLVAFGKADTQGESVSVLVLLNAFNTLWRCGVSIYLLVSSPGGAAVGAATASSADAQAQDGCGGPAAPTAHSLPLPSLAVHLSDFVSLFPKHILGSILGIFVCSRAMRANSVLAIAAVGLAYTAVVLAWDEEVRQLLVTPVWSRLRPLLQGQHNVSHAGPAEVPPRRARLPKRMAARPATHAN
ncbi:hypothetical protein, conserved [Leishmania tarentolae]|uniref:Protein RFT1 homolog n=1 Tax=Leishmania tarentolae TaxID=5689 RepID=A0A640KKB8_LEITA|nr:hypothetical protein, conserved [Leishmania tarentolae]